MLVILEPLVMEHSDDQLTFYRWHFELATINPASVLLLYRFPFPS